MSFHTRLRGRNLARASIAVALAGLAAVGAGLASAATGPPSSAATPTSPSGGVEPVADGTHSSVTVWARQHVLRGRRDLVRGTVAPARRGRLVLIQTHRGHGGWRTVVRTRTGPKGRFSTAWRTHSIGQYALRAKVAGGGPTRRARRDVTVYKASAASWYGPGFYGNRTACGRRLSSGTLGVANKTLPCGTKVALYYRGHAVTVPVIDRGPYVSGREYDLTGATKRRLHFGSTGTVWSAPRTR